MEYTINPKTKRKIQVNSSLYKKLVRDGDITEMNTCWKQLPLDIHRVIFQFLSGREMTIYMGLIRYLRTYLLQKSCILYINSLVNYVLSHTTINDIGDRSHTTYIQYRKRKIILPTQGITITNQQLAHVIIWIDLLIHTTMFSRDIYLIITEYILHTQPSLLSHPCVIGMVKLLQELGYQSYELLNRIYLYQSNSRNI